MLAGPGESRLVQAPYSSILTSSQCSGGLRACEAAYGRAVVEEVRAATEGERIVSGLFPEEFKKLTAWRWERM